MSEHHVWLIDEHSGESKVVLGERSMDEAVLRVTGMDIDEWIQEAKDNDLSWELEETFFYVDDGIHVSLRKVLA